MPRSVSLKQQGRSIRPRPIWSQTARTGDFGMPAGDEPKGAGADPGQPVHESKTVVQNLDLDSSAARDADDNSATPTGLADLDQFATALIEIGLLDTAE